MSNAPVSHDGDVVAVPVNCDTLEMIIAPREKDLGGGFKVRRILPFHKRRMVGPFIFFDHFGPVDYAPGKGFDVRPHPHIGLSTVTYLFDGAIRHKDSVGNDLVIRPGAVNWMTAARGIVHSERTPPEERATGQRMHGIQTWLALPRAHENAAPDFIHHPADTLPVIDLNGAKLRLLAGAAFGEVSPVEFPHPIWYLAGDAVNTARFTIPAEAADERAIYLADGELKAGTDTLQPGQMAILKPGCDVEISAEAGAKFMLAGGAPLPERRYIEWNLVASDPALIKVAKADWQAAINDGFPGGRFPMPDGETEWIPLPEG